MLLVVFVVPLSCLSGNGVDWFSWALNVIVVDGGVCGVLLMFTEIFSLTDN